MADTLKFKDRDRLYASEMVNNESSVVYGGNGHYSVGAYYDLIGDKYNKQANVDAAKDSVAGQNYITLTDEETMAVGLL